VRKPRCEVTNRMCEAYHRGRCLAKGSCSYKEQTDTEVEMAEKSITRKDLVKTAAHIAELKHGQAVAVVDVVIGQIRDTLAQGGEVSIASLGKFRVKATKARTARNPQTGETVQVPAKKKVVFRPAKDLKEVVE
jgi:DNA-binding protein HU-beta